MKKVVKIKFAWDDRDTGNEGWYVVAYNEKDEIAFDSEDGCLGFDVDNFKNSENRLRYALRHVFPDATIERVR